MRPLLTQSSPSLAACPTVLIEGRPVAVLSLQQEDDSIPAALPCVLAAGQPVAVISAGQSGISRVVGVSEE